jgi:hypothetical protein
LLFLLLFKCVSGLSVVAVSGDDFYTLSFYLRTLMTMSRFGWGERVVVDKKKLFLLLLKPFDRTIIIKMAE